MNFHSLAPLFCHTDKTKDNGKAYQIDLATQRLRIYSNRVSPEVIAPFKAATKGKVYPHYTLYANSSLPHAPQKPWVDLKKVGIGAPLELAQAWFNQTRLKKAPRHQGFKKVRFEGAKLQLSPVLRESLQVMYDYRDILDRDHVFLFDINRQYAVDWAWRTVWNLNSTLDKRAQAVYHSIIEKTADILFWETPVESTHRFARRGLGQVPQLPKVIWKGQTVNSQPAPPPASNPDALPGFKDGPSIRFKGDKVPPSIPETHHISGNDPAQRSGPLQVEWHGKKITPSVPELHHTPGEPPIRRPGPVQVEWKGRPVDAPIPEINLPPGAQDPGAAHLLGGVDVSFHGKPVGVTPPETHMLPGNKPYIERPVDGSVKVLHNGKPVTETPPEINLLPGNKPVVARPMGGNVNVLHNGKPITENQAPSRKQAICCTTDGWRRCTPLWQAD